MATIAEVRARRAAELAEEKRLQEEYEAKQRANLLARDRATLKSYLQDTGLDYTMPDGAAVALIEDYRVQFPSGGNEYRWLVEKDGHHVEVKFYNGSDRADYLLKAFDEVDALIANPPQQPEPVGEVVVSDGVAYLLNDRLQVIEEVQTETDAAAFVVEERVIALERRVASLMEDLEALETRIDELESDRAAAQLEADCKTTEAE